MALLNPSLPEPPATDLAYPAFVCMLRGIAALAGMLPQVSTILNRAELLLHHSALCWIRSDTTAFPN